MKKSDTTNGRDARGYFTKGNALSVGNIGGGRPRSEIKDLIAATSPKVWLELQQIAFSKRHPLHERHAFDALRCLSSYCFPKPTTVAIETPGATWASLLNLVDDDDLDAAAPTITEGN